MLQDKKAFMISKIRTEKTYNTAIHSILGELKYRILYLLLLTTALVTLIYFNFGFYIEFQNSYYLNYYQCIDFNWSEGIKELNESAAPNGCNVSNSFCFTDRQGLGAEVNTISSPKAQLYRTLDSTSSMANAKSDTLHLLQGLSRRPTGPFLNRVSPILIEIDEFKQFFVNFVIYFSGQVAFLYDLSASNFNKSLNPQDLSQRLVFSFYVMLLFYQLTAFLAYHSFCFLSPATTKQFRLKLFSSLQMLLSILLIHFLALPYAVSINEELSIESLDSELFFSVNFDLLNSWIECFYYLLLLAGFFMVYYLYLKRN